MWRAPIMGRHRISVLATPLVQRYNTWCVLHYNFNQNNEYISSYFVALPLTYWITIIIGGKIHFDAYNTMPSDRWGMVKEGETFYVSGYSVLIGIPEIFVKGLSTVYHIFSLTAFTSLDKLSVNVVCVFSTKTAPRRAFRESERNRNGRWRIWRGYKTFEKVFRPLYVFVPEIFRSIWFNKNESTSLVSSFIRK